MSKFPLRDIFEKLLKEGRDMKRILDFNVAGQDISKSQYCNFDNIYRGTKGYLFTRFSFDHTWVNTIKVALFESPRGSEQVVLNDDICEVPELILASKEWTVQVTGVRKDFKITTGRERVTQK